MRNITNYNVELLQDHGPNRRSKIANAPGICNIFSSYWPIRIIDVVIVKGFPCLSPLNATFDSNQQVLIGYIDILIGYVIILILSPFPWP